MFFVPKRLLPLLALLLLALPLLAAAPADSAAFNVEAATQHYLNTLSPAQKASSDAYFEGGYWLQLWGLLYGLAVAAVFLGLGLSRRMQAWAGRLPGRVLPKLAYFALYIGLSYALSFPLSLYTDYFREHQYGLSNQSFGAWLTDDLKNLAISMVVGSLVLLALYAAIRRTGRSWWAWATGLAAIFLVVGVFLSPIFISPLFNKYTPLPAGPVRSQILSMARANGVPADNVYVVDASRQSKRISANVSGLGSTIRVSLNDNLLNRGTPAEVQAVMGHELGHYVLNHIPKMLIFFVLIVGLGLAFVDWAFHRLLGRYGSRWGISSIGDVGGLPLAAALFSVFMLLARPGFNTIIRTQEQEADTFGLNAARQPDGFASTAMKLSEYRKIDPSPWEEIIFFDHPSGHTRVQSAMRWKAEHMRD
ncbi:M48 family peptidase [Hymenobacter aquaticus]|uniref:M48 family peptidase n=1 Tax=Hymenobacter aquaticus TaxID=1867101 RepID=A0A4Z0PWF1_9BACT|nr:M48 family metallopeptidase [Hymenobacter aquaticus]TGE21281.1 M48 family peptidase [Hymenobacter aquaticus]